MKKFESMVNDVPFLKNAVEQNNAAAMFWLAWNYFFGYNGVSQDISKALELLKKSAALGYGNALYTLGITYLTGEDGEVERDPVEAVKCFEAGASKGHVESMYELSRCLQRGEGIPVDNNASLHWLKQAADGGLPIAQCKLGEAYGNGEGVDKNMDLSFKYLSLAANQGNAEAEYCLGVIYRDGDGIPKNVASAKHFFELSATHGYIDGYVELYRLIGREGALGDAIKYLEKAAEGNHVEAQLVVGMHFEIGHGVRKNISIAKQWYKLAARNGNKKALECLQRLE